MTEGRVNELEDRAIEIIQYEKQRKRLKIILPLWFFSITWKRWTNIKVES